MVEVKEKPRGQNLQAAEGTDIDSWNLPMAQLVQAVLLVVYSVPVEQNLQLAGTIMREGLA